MVSTKQVKKSAIDIQDLSFRYGAEEPLLFKDLSFRAPTGSRVLLLGANGVGKSTLLRLVGGKHKLSQGQILVHGQDPFTGLPSARDVSLVSGHFPVTLDLEVAELLDGMRRRPEFGGEKLLKELIVLLEVDESWRMHRVSTGQRRRVDLLSAMAMDPKVLLLDEVTSDLDVLGRQDFLSWLQKRSDQKQTTVLFATHILDGLNQWATQVLLLGFQSVLYSGECPRDGSLTEFALRHMRGASGRMRRV